MRHCDCITNTNPIILFSKIIFVYSDNQRNFYIFVKYVGKVNLLIIKRFVYIITAVLYTVKHKYLVISLYSIMLWGNVSYYRGYSFLEAPVSKPDHKPTPSYRISAVVRQFGYCHTIF
jgi:hypothetical protein